MQTKLFPMTANITYVNKTKTLYLPPNARISRIDNFVVTGFNDSGTDLLGIGITGTLAKYVSALSVASGGASAVTLLASAVESAANSTGIIITYTGQNGNASAGECNVTLWCVQE